MIIEKHPRLRDGSPNNLEGQINEQDPSTNDVALSRPHHPRVKRDPLDL